MNDHVLLLRAIILGIAQWHPFPAFRQGGLRAALAQRSTGEIAIRGIRFAVSLDRFGCPVLTDVIREAIREAEHGRSDDDSR